MNKAVLVTGGAGYIGSHVAHALIERGEVVVVLDNLVSGERRFVPPAAQFVQGSAGDAAVLRQVLLHYDVETILHFAGSIMVPESIERPLQYYLNNTEVSRTLLKACVELKVYQFIFSSTAAVYGSTGWTPVDERAPTLPLNPYGRSKLMVEWMLEDVARISGLRHVALRYFNVAGVDLRCGAGQPDRQVPHLIKRAVQVALGLASHLDIFGTDYPTRDGTAVRDYIDIRDLVQAHLLALDHIRAGGARGVYNCGYGKGASVLDVVGALERVTGRPLNTCAAPRREGDVGFVVADSERLCRDLGWRPMFGELEFMVRSALEWEQQPFESRVNVQ